MQVKIYIEEKFLEELSSFLLSVPYEHSITYYTARPSQSDLGPVVEVSLFYNDYVQLKDMKIANKNNGTT